MRFLDYGWDPAMMPENASGIPARITAVSRDLFQFVCEQGSGLARLKTAEYTVGGEVFPTTGDFVLLDWQPAGESRILKTLPRKTYFSRLDPSSSGHGEQAVAANFDTVFIMQSLNYNFNLRRLERYLTLAWQSGAVPAVVLTKADLVQDHTAVSYTHLRGRRAGVQSIPETSGGRSAGRRRLRPGGPATRSRPMRRRASGKSG